MSQKKTGGKIQDTVSNTTAPQTSFIRHHACGLTMECEERRIAAVVGALVADAAGALCIVDILKMSVTPQSLEFQ